MRRGTTPTITLTITNSDGGDCDLTEHELYITFQEKPSAKEKNNARLSLYGFTKRETDKGVEVFHEGKSTIIGITLSQAETLGFSSGRTIQVQLRCKALGIAQATTIDGFKAEEILLDGEI